MAQSKALLSFRARLRSRGYTDISIKRAHDPSGEMTFDQFGNPFWFVKCTEPLLGYQAIFVCSEPQMCSWPGIALEDSGYFSYQMSMFENGKQPAGYFEDINIPDYEGGEGLFV